MGKLQTILAVIIIILAIAAVILYLLYRYGQKMELRQAKSQKLLDAYTQVVSLLIIDKKRMRLKDAPFPDEVYKETPFYMRWMNVYVVRAKIGPRVADLLCEKAIFDSIAVRTTITAKLSGIYIKEILKGENPNEKELERRKKAKAKAAKKAAKERS